MSVKLQGRMDADLLRGHDAGQVRMMEEMCVMVDNDDNVLGPVSKKECKLLFSFVTLNEKKLNRRTGHLNESIRGGMLHRAFSVFLFNNEGRLGPPVKFSD
jgi:isopentenyl-diphosphate delta-isomerase